MKSNQFCSVCKEWLDMEVVPTSDGEEDDGVIWFRCPQCQGFLPKLSGSEGGSESESESAPESTSGTAVETGDAPEPAEKDSLPWDSPADMMAAREKDDEDAAPPAPRTSEPVDVPVDLVADKVDEADAPKSEDGKKEETDPGDPIHEYRALLASKDQIDPAPYRPWETYEVGQCILHQAWDDCGVVVAKESLPGGREVIKCYFGEAGVVRLIEKAPR